MSLNHSFQLMSDTLSPQQRSYCMSRVKNKDTGIEIVLRSALHNKGYRFRKHVKNLPGRPDIVFPKACVAVFVDGDFWHGYRFPLWENKLPEFWKNKIKINRQRDQRNFRKLRKRGWVVIRLWQHEIEKDIAACISRIVAALEHAEVKEK